MLLAKSQKPTWSELQAACRVNGNERHLHWNDHLQEVARSPCGPFLRGNRAPRLPLCPTGRTFVCVYLFPLICVSCVTLCMCISFLAYLYFYPHRQNLSGLPASRDKTVCSLAWPIRKNLLCKYCQVKLLSNTFFTLVKFF